MKLDPTWNRVPPLEIEAQIGAHSDHHDPEEPAEACPVAEAGAAKAPALGSLELRLPLTSVLSVARARVHLFFDTGVVYDQDGSEPSL